MDDHGFGLDNLPYGVISHRGGPPAAAVRFGDHALPLGEPSLDRLLAAGPQEWEASRERARAAIEAGAELLPLAECEPRLPFAVADFVDFFACEHHAARVGSLFRPGGDPLPPAWRHMPLAYHGRAGTVVVSGTPVRRPVGLRGPGDRGEERRLDFELELGFVVGSGGIFGVVLLNDWSAREIQRFEYVPLGPFLGKSFATSISAWVVPAAALALDALDVELEVERSGEVVTRVNASMLHWTPAQMLEHMTSNGAPARPGDLFGSGTISGPEPGARGCLLEDGPDARFLADGEEVVMRGRAGRLSLGEVRGRVLPSRE